MHPFPLAEPRLIEADGILCCYADGIASIEILGRGGANIRITFFEYRRVGGEDVRMPVLELIRPRASVLQVAELHQLLVQGQAVIKEAVRH